MAIANEFAMLIGHDEFALVTPGSIVYTTLLGPTRPLVILAFDGLVENGLFACRRIILAYDHGLAVIKLHRSTCREPDETAGIFVVRLVRP